jgi:hypothetical protein
MKKIRERTAHWFMFAVAFAGFVAGIDRVSAGPIALSSGDFLPNTDGVWRVFFDDPITLSFDRNNMTNETIGTLIQTTTRVNNDPLTVRFQQEFETPTSAVRGGLRINFQAMITNTTGVSWSGHQLELFDDAPAGPNVPPDATHPAWPHFHPWDTPNVDAEFSPYLVDVTSYKDPGELLFISNDGFVQVEEGQSFGVQNLLIHERQFAPADLESPDPGRRIFRLVDTPVPVPPPTAPEPGTLALLCSGLAIVGVVAWRRRERMKSIAV